MRKFRFKITIVLIFTLSVSLCTYNSYGDSGPAEPPDGYSSGEYHDSTVRGDIILDEGFNAEEKSWDKDEALNREYVSGTTQKTDSETAKLIFTNPVYSENMTFQDGLGNPTVTTGNPLYSELAQYANVWARKFYKGNDLNIRLNQNFFSLDDNEFIVVITYWDFGDGAGTIYLDYDSQSGDGAAPKRIAVRKPGITARWRTENIYINDARFAGTMDYDSCIKLVTMGYNAFSRIQVVNLSAAKRNSGFKRAVYNTGKAETLSLLGIYDWNTDDDSLAKALTAEEAIAGLLKACGHDKWVSAAPESETIPNADPKYQKYIAYAAQENIIRLPGFNSKSAITVSDLLEYYLKFTGHNKAAYEADILQFSYNERLVEDKDVILYADAPATFDVFAAVAYNAMAVKRIGKKHSILSDMIQDSVIGRDLINTIGDVNLLILIYEVPSRVEPEMMIDPETGMKMSLLNINNAITILPYLTQQRWTSDGKRFIAADNATGAIYEYNTETYMLQYLDSVYIQAMADAVLTPHDVMYYNKNNREVWRMDLKTYDKKKIAELPEYTDLTNNVMTIQVTNDGRYVSCYWKEQRGKADYVAGVNRMRHIVRLDTETGEWDTTGLIKEFDDVLAPDAGHPIINPVYSNLVSFCHESAGKASINDRIWLGNYDTGESYNLFKEAIRRDGISGEAMSHELWSADGNYIIACKNYNKVSTIGEKGLVKIKLDGLEREYINADYDFFHATPDAALNWIAGDVVPIGGRDAAVVLVNTKTYESILLTSYKESSASHPYHPHPVFNAAGTKISFQRRNSSGVLAAAWIDVSEITQNPSKGGRYEIAPDVTLVSYQDAQSACEPTEYQGTVCYKIERGNAIYLDYSDEKAYTLKGKLKVRFSYLDIGRQPLNVQYTSGVNSARDYSNRENMTITIPRRNSKQWIHREITIDNINLANACKFQSDIKIQGVQSIAYIKDITMGSE